MLWYTGQIWPLFESFGKISKPKVPTFFRRKRLFRVINVRKSVLFTGKMFVFLASDSLDINYKPNFNDNDHSFSITGGITMQFGEIYRQNLSITAKELWYHNSPRTHLKQTCCNIDFKRTEHCCAAVIFHSCHPCWTILLHPIQLQQHCSTDDVDWVTSEC